MHRILVIGGTGRVGGHVLSQLSSAGTPARAMIRRTGPVTLPPGVETMYGDLTLPHTLDACLDGIDTVFLVWTAPAGAVTPALERITRHARRIVFLSAPIKTPHPFFQQPNRQRDTVVEIERQIENSGLEWTFLRPGMFASNAALWWTQSIRAGDVVRWPYPSAPTAPIDDRDIAAIAVRALCQDGHAGAEYVLTGPESLTQAEQVSAIGRALGRSLRVEEITEDEARRELLYMGPLPLVNLLLAAWAAALGQPAHMSSTFADLTGTPPRTFQQWATDHAAEFKIR